MRKYETFFIVDPELTEEAYTLVGDKLKGIVDANGGAVLTYVSWGKKKLAYPVKKRNQGLYMLMEYGGGAQLVAELERNMRLDERVLKFITVKLEDRFDPEKEEARKNAAAQALAEAEEAAHKEAEGQEEYEAAGEDELGEEEEPA
jgi:small subunit ribosomal protein S6